MEDEVVDSVGNKVLFDLSKTIRNSAKVVSVPFQLLVLDTLPNADFHN